MDNKYSVYRNIRYNRTYRTLGKMSWWRVVLGAVLIVYVLLLSGLVSQIFATREQFVIAEKLMISPEWMEKYKPETKAFIEAGVLYQNGKINEALDEFKSLENFEAADVMISRASLKLVSEMINNLEYADAYSTLTSINFDFLNTDEIDVYLESCAVLCVFFQSQESETDKQYAENLRDIIELHS